MRVVLFPHTSPLLLKNVKRTPDGAVKSGYVENGGWQFEVRGKDCLAKSGNTVVNRWPKPDVIPEVAVDQSWRGGYNEVIERAVNTHRIASTESVPRA